ncbi:Flagellar biosynthesis protein FlhF [plant metagenome]|uniref:Flagellar biosynthesis protein FlhF n=1 Tax=plant metagenome TaxID=1297885 RepID=A0A484PB16_9ZZZZ
MNLSRFVGATSREVMRQVRMALGPDALIVSNRRINGGVEVMAGDPTAMAEAEATAAELPAAVSQDVPKDRPRPAAAQPAPAAPPPAPPLGAAEVLGAISALRGEMENRMQGLAWGQHLRRTPVAAALFRRLLEAGFSTALVRAMLQRLPEGLGHEYALEWARKELITHLPVLRHEDDLLGQGGVFALVGPTGVGKTTTLAKLAARCVLREGADRVLMITTDTYRIGAHEQLQIYGKLMGVPVLSVQDADGLQRVLRDMGERRIVLIDNVGISQRDRLVAEQAAMLCNAGMPVRKLLVLNAASQGDTLDEVAHAYRSGAGDDVAGCIITKLDEASRIGAALDTAIRHRLPIQYVSHGQKVPEHLTVPRAIDLVNQALGAQGDAAALYTPTDADLSALWSANQPGAGGSVQDARQQARTRQLLMAAISGPRGGLAANELDAGLAWLDREMASVQARAVLLRQQQADAALAPDALVQPQVALLEKAYPKTCHRYLLVSHARTRVAVGKDGAGAYLCASLALSDQGVALAAPLQQLELPQGSIASWAPAGSADAASRVAWFALQLPQLPTVHLFDADTALTPELLRNADALWLARCTGARKLEHEACPTTAQAISKTLTHRPVPARLDGVQTLSASQAGGMLGASAQGVADALWVAEAAVSLGARRGASKTCRYISARRIDAQGKVLAQYHGLANLEEGEAGTDELARWLVLQEESKAGHRLMVQAWQSLDACHTGVDRWIAWALVAGQLGAAAWQVRNAAGAQSLRRVLAHMAEGQGNLTDRQLVSGLLKLYALTELSQAARG